ncbi:MAG TPA: immunoglobulin domain-containing protein, partial [Verrucomicrobiae bacterium]|nr:immunoglobulin domain-containing protein [Verrucomicrobiae bacterium]
TVTAGQDASFTVAASGAPDVAYQWLKDGTNAPYATANSATLLIPNAQTTDATTYSVIVSNAGGSVTSSVVSLTVIVPEPPVLDGGSLHVMNDGNLQFSFSGTENAAYRVWATTNVSLTPVTSTWTLVGSGIFGAAPVPFTDINSTNFPQRFYLITSP